MLHWSLFAPLPQTDPEILSLPLTPSDAKPKSLKLCIFVLHYGKTVGIRLFWSKKLSQLVIETKFVYSLIDMHLKVTFQTLDNCLTVLLFTLGSNFFAW